MRPTRLPWLNPALIMVGAAAAAGVLMGAAPAVRADITSVASGANPTPSRAFLTLDIAAGPVGTQITVSGSLFLANERMTLVWDPPSNKVAASVSADAGGSFAAQVKPFAGDRPGIHRLCASVLPNPCANFTLMAPPSPTPLSSPSPLASPSPSPSANASSTASQARVVAAGAGFDLLKPPFVFLPILGGLAALFALAYWMVGTLRRPAPAALPAAAIVHRASRPDYGAEFGAPPVPLESEPTPSAWADVLPPTTPPTPAGPAEPAPPAAPDPPGGPPGPPQV